MANLKSRVESLEQQTVGHKNMYVGLIFPKDGDSEKAKAAWIAEHGAPLEGQETFWIEFVPLKAQS